MENEHAVSRRRLDDDDEDGNDERKEEETLQHRSRAAAAASALVAWSFSPQDSPRIDAGRCAGPPPIGDGFVRPSLSDHPPPHSLAQIASASNAARRMQGAASVIRVDGGPRDCMLPLVPSDPYLTGAPAHICIQLHEARLQSSPFLNIDTRRARVREQIRRLNVARRERDKRARARMEKRRRVCGRLTKCSGLS